MQNKNGTEVERFIWIHIFRVVLFDMFKKYAEVETKVLLPNTKLKSINCKYVNDTKLPITYLDSKWFTNLVKSDAFNVSGHFRLQPYKNSKKLIWIEGFQKDGYTSKARKIETTGS